MKVFVAFSYRDRDRWIRSHVIPLVEAFGVQVETGENLAGQQISEAVKNRISSCDGVIGFLTARDDPDTQGQTHRWVSDELAFAQSVDDVHVLEVREIGVVAQGGLGGDRQHIEYDPDDEPRCLVEIARVIGAWSQGVTMRLLLLPEDVVGKLRPLVSKPGFACVYSITQDGRNTLERPATLLRRPGSLQLTARGIPPGSLISVRVQAQGASYTSAWVDADAVPVQLEED
jgi:hypothetical protein